LDTSVRIDRQTTENVCVVHLEGDVDVAIVPEVRSAIDATIGGGCANLVLDLTAVTYADSSALGLLVWIDHRLSPRVGKLVLVGANRDVTRVLELSGLVGVAPSISTSPSVSSALEGLELRTETRTELWHESIDLLAKVESLSDARQKVVDRLCTVRLSDAALFDIKVAVGEALANAVRHGSPTGPTAMVHIDMSAYDDRVVIKVLDTGCGFSGEASCTGDVYASGGRGVMFMRALMDRVDFEVRPEGGTIVTLVKHIRPGAA
jgi:anti-anti-sigma factor